MFDSGRTFCFPSTKRKVYWTMKTTGISFKNEHLRGQGIRNGWPHSPYLNQILLTCLSFKMSSQQKKDLHNRRKVSYILKSTSTHCNMEPKHAAGKRKHLIFTMTPCKLPLNLNFLNFIFSKILISFHMLNKFIGMIDRKNSPAGLEITKKIKSAMRIVCLSLLKTRPKPVEHGYVFSMAVVTIGEWLKLVPFFC